MYVFEETFDFIVQFNLIHFENKHNGLENQFVSTQMFGESVGVFLA